jgi:hypothetical protein
MTPQETALLPARESEKEYYLFMPAADRTLSTRDARRWVPWRAIGLILGLTVFASCVIVTVRERSSPQVFETPIEILRRSASDIRTIGTAIESYAVDYNFYPKVTCQNADDHLPMCPATLLTNVLSPTYTRVIPIHDGWGSPYYYASFNKGTGYALLSLGSDRTVTDRKRLMRVFEAAQGRIPTEGLTLRCFEDELVFVQGQFVVYPTGHVESCTTSSSVAGGE